MNELMDDDGGHHQRNICAAIHQNMVAFKGTTNDTVCIIKSTVLPGNRSHHHLEC